MSKDRYRILEPQAPHFITCTIIRWITLFNQPALVQIVLDSWKFLQSQKRIRLYGYVILENHLHWIADAPDLQKELRLFKSYTARQIVDHLEAHCQEYLLSQLYWEKRQHKQKSDYQVWQEGSHPVAILSEEIMRVKLEYLHHNPLRRGYVERPEHWRYSSARNYAGMKGVLEIDGL